jgi:PAT family beta-lactamase induction signal transducer AmpG
MPTPDAIEPVAGEPAVNQAPARRLPVWAMGLAVTPMGFVYGFISTAMGILLASRHVSVVRVGAISAIAFSPTFWAWLLAPIVDVRFTKRAYAYFFAILAAVLLGVSVLSVDHLDVFTVALTASCAAAVLYSTSINGWMPDIVTDEEYNAVSGWINIANLGAAGVFSAVIVLLIRVLSLHAAAVVVTLLVIAPTALLLFFPRPLEPSGRLRENFSAMAISLRKVMREGRLWVGLTIFLSPIAFAMTNLFSTLGKDFAASENTVTALNGPGVAVACSIGCLVAIPLCRRLRRRSVYLLAGAGSAVAAVAMGLLPHTVAVYAVGLLAYNLFQGFNYTAFTALELEIVGPQNALSGTMMAMLTASANVPISTMTWVDSHVYGRHGLNAMFFVDAAASIATALFLMFVALPLFDRYTRRKL